ncbi:MAG: chemotaxis protein CheW [Alsobacter sp.]
MSTLSTDSTVPPGVAGMSAFAAGKPQQIVTFKVEGRSFGVDVGAVREIKGWQPTTPLPNAAAHVLGVINLRGAIIAVYDLRQRLGLGPSPVSRSSVVIVLDLGERYGGILVDAVSDIVDILPTDLRPAPDIAGDGDDVLQALLVKGDEVVALLDLHAIVRESTPTLAA